MDGNVHGTRDGSPGFDSRRTTVAVKATTPTTLDSWVDEFINLTNAETIFDNTLVLFLTRRLRGIFPRPSTLKRSPDSTS